MGIPVPNGGNGAGEYEVFLKIDLLPERDTFITPSQLAYRQASRYFVALPRVICRTILRSASSIAHNLVEAGTRCISALCSSCGIVPLAIASCTEHWCIAFVLGARPHHTAVHIDRDGSFGRYESCFW
jgi:hypothetical protein